MSTKLSMRAVLPPLPSRERVGVRGLVAGGWRVLSCSPNPPLTLALSCRPRLRKHAHAVPAADRMRSETPPTPRKGRGDSAGVVWNFMAATLLCSSFAHAQPTPDPVLEARVKALSSELRCLVCQNQTVEDSSAPVARDMKDQVRMQLAAGKSEAEVKQYMTDRFGDFVLYKPPLKATTIVLWAGPFIALAFAGLLLIRRLRRRASVPNAAPLTDVERQRARALLNDTAKP